MEIKELISSGIIEMYCMGLASDDEKVLVEKFASVNQEVRDEIASVSEALHIYAHASGKTPAASIKNKILAAVQQEVNNSSISFPPRLTKSSTTAEWLKYLRDNNISEPDNYDPVFLLDLPGDANQVTYVAWAKKGAVVEESHDSEDEYLLMLKGECSVTIDGKIGYYKAGDVVYVPKNLVHRAEALSDEPMLLIGQRVAA